MGLAKNGLKPAQRSAKEDGIAYWSGHCLPPFSSLLEGCGTYTEDQQASHIRFFQDHIIPNIGPRPVSGAAYLLAHTGSVLETSLNFTDVGKPIIRFIFQPHDYGAGISEALQSDMTWYKKLAAVFSVNDSEKLILHQKLPQLASIPQCLLGFDLHPDKRSMKAYFSPLLRHILTGEDTDALLFDTVRRMDAGFEPALATLLAFRSSEPNIRKVDVIGVDCIPPADGARIKLYTRLAPSVNNFDYIKKHLTLHGRLTSETVLQQVDILRDVWHLLLDEPAGWVENGQDKVEIGPEDPHSGIMISWEIQAGKSEPSPKLYVPLWKFSSSNRSIAERYAEIFKKWGWSWGENDRYKSVIGSAFGKDGVSDDTPVIHSYCSFTLSKKKGKYLTSYTSPILSGV